MRKKQYTLKEVLAMLPLPADRQDFYECTVSGEVKTVGDWYLEYLDLVECGLNVGSGDGVTLVHMDFNDILKRMHQMSDEDLREYRVNLLKDFETFEPKNALDLLNTLQHECADQGE